MSVRRAPGRKSVAARRPLTPWLLAGAVTIAFVAMVAALSRQGPVAPVVGDHWHARYQVEICGRTLPPLPASPGDVHTHGDGVIHVHPSTRETTGRRATLGAFVRTTMMQLAAMELITPDGRRYRDGDACPNGKPGRVQVLVRSDGERAFRVEQDFLNYRIRDRDEVRIVFAP